MFTPVVSPMLMGSFPHRSGDGRRSADAVNARVDVDGTRPPVTEVPLSDILVELVRAGEIPISPAAVGDGLLPASSPSQCLGRYEEERSDDVSDPLALAPGERIGKYIIVRQINRGGQGSVYLAHDPDLDRNVAIKVAHRPVDDVSTCAARVRKEGLLIARTHHPRLAQVYDCGVHEGHPFLVMEHVQGRTLREYAENRTLGAAEIRRIVTDIAEGLEAAHRQEILHLDLKPDNVLVTEDGRCRLIDFGMGWLLSTPVSQRYRMIGGTWQYMSPEQRSGRIQDWSPATDIFGMGGILCYLLTRRPVLSSSTINEEEIREELQETMERIRRSGAAPDLRRLCLQAIAYSPQDRVPNAASVIRHLNRAALARRRGRMAILFGVVMFLAGGWRLSTLLGSGPRQSIGEVVPLTPIPGSSWSISPIEVEVATHRGVTPMVAVWSPRHGLRQVRGLVEEQIGDCSLWRHPPDHPLNLSNLGPLSALVILAPTADPTATMRRLESKLTEFGETFPASGQSAAFELARSGEWTQISGTPIRTNVHNAVEQLACRLQEFGGKLQARVFSIPRERDHLAQPPFQADYRSRIPLSGLSSDCSDGIRPPLLTCE